MDIIIDLVNIDILIPILILLIHHLHHHPDHLLQVHRVQKQDQQIMSESTATERGTKPKIKISHQQTRICLAMITSKERNIHQESSSNTTVTDYESHTDQSSITANQKENRATFNVHANQTRSRNLSQDLSHERKIPKNKSKQTTVCKSKADGRTISSIWSKGMKCKDDSEKCDKVNLNILPMNILVEFKDEKYPFILSTDSFIDFIYDLESTVGEKINSHDYQFQYITGFAGKEYAVTIHSQITFNAFMRYMNTVKQDLVLVKVSGVTVSTQTVQSIETIENSSLHHTNEVE